MKLKLLLFLAAAMLLGTSCDGGATNTAPNSTNAGNAAKPAPAVPTAESFLEMEKKAVEAWTKGDTKHFENILSAKFVAYHQGQRFDRNEEIKMIGSAKCEVKEWNLDDPQMAKIDDSTYVVSYKGTYDGECEVDGKKMKIPSPARAATIWTKAGDLWQAAYHGETPIIDPSAPPPAAAKADDSKKEEPKKEEARSDDKGASNTAAAPAAKPQPSSNTDALVKLHTGGWEAFKSKDATWFNNNLTENVALVDPMGKWHSGKANIVRLWTETMKCEGITKVGLTDGFSTAISPTVEILTSKGSADGTCDGQKNGALYQTSVYVKQGDAWKLAFMLESPAM
ncbi:nuclear transport factor 2 family protein [Leptolyngbya sp. 7M]|uniref:nuclear transport factor 2 family protein n=1 Tax=Leptolyngbya sp. 7M TaxID=2812896 RepID=UPI001B8BC5B1|nr:nuclear transport factor 2 family protein [Leptolyngbya sp. 7M]QYO66613.1 nuclear transport factor 2 family protein [Leptolyngbya sp. 7M]